MHLRSFTTAVGYRTALLMACCLLLTGCPRPFKGHETMITQEHAIEIAKKEFESHGRLASDYTITVESYDADDRQWIVWFDKSGPFPIPGGKHAVLVDKTTGKTVFRQGQ
jgi:hypothetical protein